MLDDSADRRMADTEVVDEEPAGTELVDGELVDETDWFERTGHWSRPPSSSDNFQKAS